MRILFKQAQIFFPSSAHHLQQKDVLIENSTIVSIGTDLNITDAEVFEAGGNIICPGFFDFFAHFNTPGKEYKETIQSGTQAALAGGYTSVMILPNNSPVTHNAAQVNYLKNQTSEIEVLPIGAVSVNCDGKELSEMYDMAAAGSIAFSDGTKPLQEAGIMLKALQYVKANAKTIIQVPRNFTISKNGLMHEGVISTQAGLPGIPTITEEIMISRDLDLLRYTESKLHITGVSTVKSLELIKQAKAEGLSITCSVAPYSLYFTDDALAGYDSNLKVYPPIRGYAEKEALINALKDGTIDGVASHHFPQSWDDKEKEFEYASEGMIGLQTCFNVTAKAVGVEKAIEILAFKNRDIFGLNASEFVEGGNASFVLIDPNVKYQLTKENNRSKSANTPFLNHMFTGKVQGVFHNGKWTVNE